MTGMIQRVAALAVVLGGILGSAHVSGQIRYPGPYRGPYPYGPYRYMNADAELKVNVTPKQAEVYVDGYLAGVVDDFDGAFQRLRVVPGQHEIVVYLEGYRSIREKLYLGPSTSRKLERTMEKLAAGEANEPKPEPISPPPPPRDSQTPTPRDPRRPV
jgi:hypothetical protein